MNCEKCHKELNYGSQYCVNCGEKADIKGYEKDYNKTLWGLLDRIKNWWEMISLKKFTEHWITRSVILIALIIWCAFQFYTNYSNIKFLENSAYSIQYNKNNDEYYIKTSQETVNLSLYIPVNAKSVKFIGYENDADVKEDIMSVDEYKNEGFIVKKGEYIYGKSSI